ncbi:UDP-glucose 4-epimerase [Butyrivibrio hungatei]|uniref:UDP-glucose 4-epimerase n=1 Tax=Butyrivibrio hungatei TaxID=185008 RepID=A0A1G5G5I4_9FIRM|nr:NAD(P)-dependent oxidoreductase [Butyrivibrio hungatei]SCY46530.1 UDP-glucose 4-epimerase [Butyrivibrio hungatei]
MKILVTGANGFIGKRVCELLEEKKIGYCSGTRECFQMDNIESMRKFLIENSITNIIHLAARANSSDEKELFDSNIVGLYKLLQALSGTSVRNITFASGNNVYGELHDKNIDEEALCIPAEENIYGLSKYVGELLITDMLKKTDISFSILRIADVYGPGQKYGNLIKALVRAVAQHDVIKLYGEGKRIRDYIYIDDVAEGLIHASINELNGVYNLSTGVGTSVKELVNIGIELSEGKSSVEKFELDSEDDSRIVLNPFKISNTGYKANITVKEGLRRCVEEYK